MKIIFWNLAILVLVLVQWSQLARTQWLSSLTQYFNRESHVPVYHPHHPPPPPPPRPPPHYHRPSPSAFVPKFSRPIGPPPPGHRPSSDCDKSHHKEESHPMSTMHEMSYGNGGSPHGSGSSSSASFHDPYLNANPMPLYRMPSSLSLDPSVTYAFSQPPTSSIMSSSNTNNNNNAYADDMTFQPLSSDQSNNIILESQFVPSSIKTNPILQSILSNNPLIPPTTRLPTQVQIAETNVKVQGNSGGGGNSPEVSENLNITAMLHQAGAEELKNCIPIPNSDGACFILQDDTTEENLSPSFSPPPQEATKEIIYEAPRGYGNNNNKFNHFKPLNQNHLHGNTNNNNYFSYQILGDPRNNNNNQGGGSQGFSRGQGGKFLKLGSRRNPGGSIKDELGKSVGESLPTPQALKATFDTDADRESQGSDKFAVPEEFLAPPFDSLPESKEFYIRFLKLWAMYHKRYGCSSRPVNFKKRSVEKDISKKQGLFAPIVTTPITTTIATLAPKGNGTIVSNPNATIITNKH